MYWPEPSRPSNSEASGPAALAPTSALAFSDPLFIRQLSDVGSHRSSLEGQLSCKSQALLFTIMLISAWVGIIFIGFGGQSTPCRIYHHGPSGPTEESLVNTIGQGEGLWGTCAAPHTSRSARAKGSIMWRLSGCQCREKDRLAVRTRNLDADGTGIRWCLVLCTHVADPRSLIALRRQASEGSAHRELNQVTPSRQQSQSC